MAYSHIRFEQLEFKEVKRIEELGKKSVEDVCTDVHRNDSNTANNASRTGTDKDNNNISSCLGSCGWNICSHEH